MRVLLVEDEPDLGAMVREHLAGQSFAVDWVTTVEDAEAALGTSGYDLVVLDLTLPDGDGETLLARLRARGGSIPVLAATARDSIDQRISGLDKGMDDYLVKPYDLGELTARVRALLRRPGSAHGVTLTFGGLTLDTVAMAVSVGDMPLVLGRRQVVLLETLMRGGGRVVSRSALEERMYSLDDLVDSNALEASVSRLRRALDKAGAPARLHTVRGVGYMLSED